MKVAIRDGLRLFADGKPFFALQARHVPAGATLRDLAKASHRRELVAAVRALRGRADR